MTTTDSSWIILARILRPQGRRGELLAEILTDFPDKFGERTRLFVSPESGGPPGEPREITLEAHWLHKGRVVLKFTGVDSIGEAERLRNFAVVIPRTERMPLQDGAVYINDLLGARIIDVSHNGQKDVGEITDVLPGGIASDLLVVHTQSAEPLLIPFAKAYLKKIDLPANRIEMELPAGLMTMQDPLTEEERQCLGQETAGDDPLRDS